MTQESNLVLGTSFECGGNLDNLSAPGRPELLRCPCYHYTIHPGLSELGISGISGT